VTNTKKKHIRFTTCGYYLPSFNTTLYIKSGILYSKVQYHLVTTEIFVLLFASLGGWCPTFRDTSGLRTSGTNHPVLRRQIHEERIL